jgi:hypothetical protein
MTKSKVELVVQRPNPICVLEPLTYYDPELQNAGCEETSNPERLQRAFAKSEQLRAEYKKQLKNLRSRLNQHAYAHLMAERDPLFDSNLLQFTFGDRLGFGNKVRRTRLRTSVRATFLNFEGDRLHELSYRHIESLRVNVPIERWFEWGDGVKAIDCLLAHELTGSGDSLMQHKFLFSSGAAIAIVFAGMNWNTSSAGKVHSKR